METIHNAHLTSAELSQIWSSYQQDTMSICVLKYFLETVEDPNIAEILQQALELSQSHVPKLTNFFTGEKWPVPKGFTEADVNLNTPRLFTDSFMLYYIQQMGTLGVNGYSMGISLAARPDIHTYFTTCITESFNLHAKANDLLLEKGLFIRSPYLTPPDSIDFVTDQKFLGGWIGENRPLISLEIANLYANIQRNALGNSLMTGFSQIAGTEKIRKYMVKGKGIAAKHIEVFSSKLNQDELPASVTSDSAVTNSTVSPFSDKLMMYHTSALIAISVAYYGTSMSTSLRKDLMTDYTRLSAENMKYAGEGAKMIIDKGWMEKPPQAQNRDQLAKNKD